MMTDYRPLAPYALLTILALVIALLGTVPAARRSGALGWITAIGAGLALFISSQSPEATPWLGMLRLDAFSKACNVIFLAALAIISIASTAEEHRTAFAGEFYALLTLSTVGLMLMGASGGLLTMYLGLELSTIALFALAGFSKREKRSAEAALKLLILGSVASAVVLYGASIVYGVLGTTQFFEMSAAMSHPHAAGASAALYFGITFIVAGLAFKVAAVPFHLWAPDVYEGAPSLVTAFLSTASKAGGFAALLRFLGSVQVPEDRTISTLLIVLSAISMIVGNLSALSQKNFKRMLGYSGVAQSGYILTALAGGSATSKTISSALMYLLLYAFTNVAAFLVAQAIHDATGSDQISALRGLHRRRPTLAFCAVVVMFSLGGIPPLAGFVGKLYLFTAAWDGGQRWLVLIGALTSVAALYYYLMVVRQIYLLDPEDDRKITVAPAIVMAISLCTAAILAIGIYPRPFVTMGEAAASAVQVTSVAHQREAAPVVAASNLSGPHVRP